MPKRPEASVPRQAFLSIRMLEEEKAQAQQMAKEQGVDASRFVRNLIRAAWLKRKAK